MVPRGGVYGSRRSSARPGESWATEGALGRWSFRLTTARSCALKGVRGVFVVESDLGHLEEASPLGLVRQTILERAARVLLGDPELYRFRVVKLGQRV